MGDVFPKEVYELVDKIVKEKSESERLQLIGIFLEKYIYQIKNIFTERYKGEIEHKELSFDSSFASYQINLTKKIHTYNKNKSTLETFLRGIDYKIEDDTDFNSTDKKIFSEFNNYYQEYDFEPDEEELYEYILEKGKYSISLDRIRTWFLKKDGQFVSVDNVGTNEVGSVEVASKELRDENESTSKIHDLLNKLPNVSKKEQKIFLAHAIDKLKYEEIAKKYKMTYSMVSTICKKVKYSIDLFYKEEYSLFK